MNCDTVALPGALDSIVAYLEERPEVGVAAPRMLNRDLSDQATARSFPTAAAAIFGRRALLTRLFPDNRWSRRYLVGSHVKGDDPFAVDWVSAACMVVPKSVVEEVGPLDAEGFPMYWVEADWCHRIRRAGYEVHSLPSSGVMHYEQGGRGWRAASVWNFHRGAYRYYAKHSAPMPLHPLRLLAWVGLPIRAALIIAAHELARPLKNHLPRLPSARRVGG
jgi:GT2 family glycosyltransferase